MASGQTISTMQCPQCKEPVEFTVRARHLTKTKVALSLDLDPVREHIAEHQAQFAMELPPPAQHAVAVRLDNSDACYTPTRPLAPLVGHDVGMTTYDGPATVTADGEEYEVTANLAIASSGGLKEWHGSLTALSDGASWNIQEADTTTLRIGQGREGAFIATHAVIGSTQMQIQGSGLPPFEG